MVGLMQIMIYMLCVYLVYKGVEIFQVALMSTRADRKLGLIIGVLSVGSAVVFAVGFFVWAESVAQSIGNRMNTFPTLP